MKPLKPLDPMTPMKPMKPLDFGAPWWPENLGEPAASGGQGGMRYAFFPETHRLVVERDGTRNIYDSGDHRIGGVQQQSGEAAFASQHGTVRLQDLKVVE